MEVFVTVLTIFVLAMFIGFEVITKVPPTLHTPLMSGSNAISGITIIGAILSAGSQHSLLTSILGLVAAAYVEAMLPLDSLGALGAGGLDIVVVSLVAIPSYVCAGSATPLAATLLAKGLSPGAVLAGLLLGPATNVATLGFLRAAYGLRATVAGLLATVAAVWTMALALNLTPLGAHVAAAPMVEHPATLLEFGATAAMAALVLWSLWRGGVRTWLAELGVGHVHAH